MTTMTHLLKIGSRTSKLALWQSRHIIDRLQTAWPGLECRIEPFVTQGDKTLDKPLPQIGGKGLFTAELEAALRDGRIDIAVHSLKDLPVEDAPGLTLGAITSRAPVGDGLVAREGWTLETLPPGAIVGTSSNRRRAQLLAVRPDLQVRSIRGNVQTRARKVAEGEYHATVLAEAGLRRLGMAHLVSQWLPLETMLPAPGQGALAVQCRAGDERTLSLLAAIEDEGVRTAVTAERAFLSALGGGCSAPIAAYAHVTEGNIQLEAMVASVDGRHTIKLSGRSDNPATLGRQLAAQATAQGANTLLANLQSSIFNLQPLSGKRILVTRPREQAEAFADKLASLGAEPVVFPTIQFQALPVTLPPVETYDWILFTSVNAVVFFFENLEDQRLKIKDLASGSNLQSSIFNLPQIAATGPTTAQKLAEYGVHTDFVPAEFTGEALAAGLGDLTGRRVLLPRAKIGRPQLVTRLRQQGAEVDEVALYDTVTAVPTPEALAQLEQGIDVITFTSPSSIRSFLEISGGDLARTAVIACIGPVTAQQAQASGLPVHVTPENYTIDGLTEALIEYFRD